MPAASTAVLDHAVETEEVRVVAFALQVQGSGISVTRT